MRRAAAPLSFATLGLAVTLAVRPVSAERILAGYVLALAAIALAELTRSLRASAHDAPSPFVLALSQAPEPPTRPAELVRIEREITLGTTSAGHLHRRLLPVLRDAAVARLGADFTRTHLGDETWELLRPDRPEPPDRTAPGLSLRRVRAIVEQLERG